MTSFNWIELYVAACRTRMVGPVRESAQEARADAQTYNKAVRVAAEDAEEAEPETAEVLTLIDSRRLSEAERKLTGLEAMRVAQKRELKQLAEQLRGNGR